MIGGMFKTYKDYMDSDIWKEKCDYIKKMRGNYCELCGVSGKEIIYKILCFKEEINNEKCLKFQLEKKCDHTYKDIYWVGRTIITHHLNYKRVCNERSKDLILLCIPCHKYVHPIGLKINSLTDRSQIQDLMKEITSIWPLKRFRFRFKFNNRR